MLGISLRAATLGCLIVAAAPMAIAQADKPISFEGQTISFIVPSSTGGGSDFQARLFARHMPKHLPGSPDIVVQNIPGGGGLKGLAYFLEINPQSDLSFAMISSSLPFRTRMGKVPESVFDPHKMPWIGSASDSTNYCAFTVDLYEDFEELKDKEITMGSTSKSGMGHALNEIVVEALELNVKYVTGYENAPSKSMALERGEIDGTCGSMDSYPTSTGPLVDQGKAEFAFYLGPHRRDDIDAPYLLDLPMTPEKRELADTALWSISFGRPFTLHPDADPALLPIFREAFKATMEDPEFLADTKKAGVRLRYTSGEEMEERTDRLYATSDDLLSKINTIVFE